MRTKAPGRQKIPKLGVFGAGAEVPDIWCIPANLAQGEIAGHVFGRPPL